jgi:antitoxin component of RelBE/YafQ-DinJ toxin-antitoxin module
MRTKYDFAGMKSRRNPYARRLKRSVTIRLDDASIAYFKELAAETGVAYQSLINLYLRDCVVHRRRPVQHWVSEDIDQQESDPRFLARVARARAGLAAGGGISWEEVQAATGSEATEFRASDKPASRVARRAGRRK